jgi:Meiotically Up-regulated Gene 113 (MUG113) protein
MRGWVRSVSTPSSPLTTPCGSRGCGPSLYGVVIKLDGHHLDSPILETLGGVSQLHGASSRDTPRRALLESHHAQRCSHRWRRAAAAHFATGFRPDRDGAGWGGRASGQGGWNDPNHDERSRRKHDRVGRGFEGAPEVSGHRGRDEHRPWPDGRRRRPLRRRCAVWRPSGEGHDRRAPRPRSAHGRRRRAVMLRSPSMAQQTKTGHVYIISNIGSFGEDVYEIGLTRRLEPLDRIEELGDASVPFELDVHALIVSDDAAALERSLHRHFLALQINEVNPRKELFRVPLRQIRAERVRPQPSSSSLQLGDAAASSIARVRLGAWRGGRTTGPSSVGRSSRRRRIPH